MSRPNTIEDIDDRYLIADNGCWEFIGSTCSNGYGQMSLNGHLEMAHRISFIRNKGSIPDNLSVLHTCDNRICINPDHLFLGTYLDNAQDRQAKGRNGDHKGSMNGRALLIETDIKMIRKALDAGKTCAELAAAYGVSWPTIKYIKIGKTWSHVQ